MSIFAIVGIVLAVVVGLILLYLLVVVFGPIAPPKAYPLSSVNVDRTNDFPPKPDNGTDLFFTVGEDTVAGRLYLPENRTHKVPCIVLNTGFCGTMELGLKPFARRFAEAGIAALIFDYRHFGLSGGSPRQLFSVTRQIEDLEGAIAYARNRKEIDPKKVAVWGTSGSGGYGLIVAGKDKDIACVSGQCPSLDGHADGKQAVARAGLWFYLGFFPHASRDKGRARLGLSPHRIPIAGPVGSRALMNAPGAFEGYAKIAPRDFRNDVCARLALTHDHSLNPIDHAKNVTCPVLLQPCEKDVLVSMEGAERTAEILDDKVTLIKQPFDHFEIYTRQPFERIVSQQIAFFQKHLLDHAPKAKRASAI